MQTTPVKHYSQPRFPTRAILDAHPELLRLVPKRWRSNPAVLTALAAVTALAAGCRPTRAGESPATVSRVAPLFVYGGGRGAFGCVAVAAPVFLSEDEARQVIADEGKKAGILFTGAGQTLLDVATPMTNQNELVDERLLPQPERKSPRKRRTARRSVPLDGMDAKRKIAFEFVSQADFTAWEDKAQPPHSTVSEYDIIGTANVLREGLAAAKPTGAYAVFYDPMGLADPFSRTQKGSPGGAKASWEAAMAEAKKQSEEELRKQVRDFIAWLKAEGVI